MKNAKKIGAGVGGGGGQVRPGMGARGVGVGPGGGDWLVAKLGVGSDVGYGGCESRIEGLVQCTKRYCTILRKLKNVGGGGGGGGAIFEPKLLSMYLKNKIKKNKKMTEPGTHDLRVRKNLLSYPLGYTLL